MTVFHKIVAGEIPCSKVYEDEFTVAFHDICPQAPVHILVIPKTFAKDFEDASSEQLTAMRNTVREVVKIVGLAKDGYRIITNVGVNGGQEVPYLHFHILGGKKLKWDNFVDLDEQAHRSM
ncbi:MAG: hypothetical protein RL154_1066 [Pseudomonadota bacterium]|jgi:histidine triad (HIT) family protein